MLYDTRPVMGLMHAYSRLSLPHSSSFPPNRAYFCRHSRAKARRTAELSAYRQNMSVLALFALQD